jgi:hypothetical protein
MRAADAVLDSPALQDAKPRPKAVWSPVGTAPDGFELWLGW